MHWHTDPGHGWLAIPARQLADLGIAGDISVYSYVSADGETVYLEEDCDARVFARAYEAAGLGTVKQVFDAPGVHVNCDSFVRRLKSYTPPIA